MENENLEEKRENVINAFVNTKKLIRTIAKENNISIEEVYAILQTCNNIEKMKRNSKIVFSSELDEKIYNLRKSRNSYQKIAQETGLSSPIIRKRCKKIFEQKGEKITKVKEFQEESVNKLIYDLRKRRFTYEKIMEELEKKGIKINLSTIRKRCKKIYELKGEQVPKAKKNKNITDESRALNEKIYNLREQGLTFKKIAEELTENGTPLTSQRVEQRFKKTLKLNDQELAKAILNLTITRKATIEQIKQIADYYGVDLEKTMNSLEEPTDLLEER